MDIRLLPMSKIEFEKLEDVIDFLTVELKRRGGNYYFRRKSISFKDDIVICFQYSGMIVASAIMMGQSDNGKIENGVEYKGYYQFDPNSFIVYDKPIKAEAIKDIMPEFKGFNQSTQFLSNDCMKLLR